MFCLLLTMPSVGAGYEGFYRIKSPRSNRYLTNTNNQVTVSTATAIAQGDMSQVWEVRALGDGSYVIINASTGGMVLNQTTRETPFPTSNTSCKPFWIRKSSTKYIVSQTADFGALDCWHESGSNKVVVWNSTEANSQWTFTAIADDELAAAQEAIAANESRITTAINNMTKMAVLEKGGIFRLKSRYDHYAREVATTNTVSTASTIKANDLTQIWAIIKNGSTYYIRNASTGRFLPATGGPDAALVTTLDATSYYIKTSDYSGDYYTISWNENYKNGTCLHENAAGNVVKWNPNTASDAVKYSDWSIEPLTEADDQVSQTELAMNFAKAQGIATEITDGYYVLVPNAYPTRALQEGKNGTTAIATTILRSGKYSQVWKVTLNSTGTKCTFQNVLTEKYIRNNATTSTAFTMTTGTTGTEFTIGKSGAPWNFFFNFNGSSTGFHCASSANYNVVGWSATDAASQWVLYPVEVDEAALAEEKALAAQGADIETHAADYNKKLQKYFADFACTVLRDEYKTMTEEQLCAAMAEDELPEMMQKMAVTVLTDKWDNDRKKADGTYYYSDDFNRFYKLFRVQDVECYSDNSAWKTITNVGPFGELTSPTGIVGSVGDYVYIYVDDNPPTDGTLRALLANDTGYRNAGELTLRKGINVWQLPNDGEIFLNYFNANTSKLLKDFPPIRVHIEGGKVNGCWDLSRGMTNADWAKLKSWRTNKTCDIFKSDFLHVKGLNTVLNVLTANVVPATQVEEIMKGWDYAFLGLQKAIGHTGQWDGRYNPVVNPRHSYEGNPNWGGYAGSNHPGLTSRDNFNYDNFYKGNIWEILHEIGHGCQYPIKMAGSTEVTNNSLANIVSNMMGGCYSRGNGADKLMQLFNYERDGKKGWSWLDYMRYATPHYDASLHVSNHLLYQLYLYFEVEGHSPGFLTRMHNEMRRDPIRTTGKSAIGQNSIATYNDDFWKFAKACATASQTNLWEFFEAYGFWKYTDEIISTSDDDPAVGSTAYNNGHRFVGDYGNYSMKFPVRNNTADENAMKSLKEYMESMPKSAPNVMFIEDRVERQYITADCFVGSMDKSRVGQERERYWKIETVPFFTITDGTLVADYGQYTNFDGKDRTANLSYTIGTTNATQAMHTDKGGEWNYTVAGKKITMKGDGILGIKIYNADGKLCHLSNTKTFIVPDDMAAGLKTGAYVLHVAATADKDIVMGTDGKPVPTTGIDAVEAGKKFDGAIYDMTGRRVQNMLPGHIYIQNGKKIVK